MTKREVVTANALSSLTALSVVETDGFADYRLLDSGNGRKLERFGKYVVDRPEPPPVGAPVGSDPVIAALEAASAARITKALLSRLSAWSGVVVTERRGAEDAGSGQSNVSRSARMHTSLPLL